MAAFLTLQCCGRVTRGDSAPLALTLDVPQSEDPALFWYGVQTKVLRVKAKKSEESVDFPWEAGARNEIDLHEGDHLEFRGTDGSGRLLVTGEAVVGEEKKLTIPLHRVL